MKVKIIFFLAVVIFVTGCMEARSQKYSSDAGRFAVQFPNTPIERDQEIDTESGKILFHSIEAKDEGYDYAVTFIDYPIAIVEEKGSKAILEDASAGAVSNVFGTLLDKNEIVLGNYSGISQTVETLDKIFTSSILLAENRLYVVIVTGPKEGFPFEKAQEFLDSFELLPNE